MSKNMKKNLIIILLLIIVVGLSTYVVKDYLNNNNTKLEQPIIDTFLYDFRDGYDYSSGSAQILGYVEITNRNDGLSNEMYKYVTFHVLESNSENFMKYLESNADGTYISKDSIGLGCLMDNTIKLLNYSDLYDPNNSIITIDLDIDKLMASTKDNPIKLNIGKYVNTIYYSYHPVCESMVSFFTVPTK